MRVAFISNAPQAVAAYASFLPGLGHDLAGVLCTRGPGFATNAGLYPDGLDVVAASSRERVVPLLRSLEPDLVLCTGFPWKLGQDVLDVPPLGAVNFHPSALPRYRGPIPVAWAVRRGEREVGLTFHRMDTELDTGPILAQGSVELGDEHSWDELGPKMVAAMPELLSTVLERVERGDPGDPQPEGGEYLSHFEPEYAEIDPGSTREAVARQVQAWRFAVDAVAAEAGACTELDGKRVRVLRVSLEPADVPQLECVDGPVWILESEDV